MTSCIPARNQRCVCPVCGPQFLALRSCVGADGTAEQRDDDEQPSVHPSSDDKCIHSNAHQMKGEVVDARTRSSDRASWPRAGSTVGWHGQEKPAVASPAHVSLLVSWRQASKLPGATESRLVRSFSGAVEGRCGGRQINSTRAAESSIVHSVGRRPPNGESTSNRTRVWAIRFSRKQTVLPQDKR